MILTWTVADVPSVYSRKRVMAVLERACDAWSKALSGKVRFQYLTPDEAEDEQADIVFGFARLTDKANLGHHAQVGEASVITFRDSLHNGAPQVWEFTFLDRFKAGAAHFLSVALHEIGHALGCKDHVAPGAGCMEPDRNKRWLKPTRADIELVIKTLRK